MPQENDTLCIAIQMNIKLFEDEDHLAIKACTELCKQLEEHLKEKKYSIPDWLQNGGCDEDWGVYYEAEINDIKLKILFGYYPEDDLEDAILLRIYPYLPFFKSLFKKPKRLSEEIKSDFISFSQNYINTKIFEE